MSEQKKDSLDDLGSRLDAAFTRSDATAKGKRWRATAFSLAAVALIAGVAWVVIGSSRGDRVFTIEQAIAEVQQGSFELPDPGTEKMLYINQEMMWSAGAGTTTRSGKRIWTNQLVTLRQEQWTNPSRNGMSRSSFIEAKYASPRDEEAAKQMQAENDRERRRIERERRKRGDRRPVPRFPVWSPPFTSPDSSGKPKSKPLVCPLGPTRGWMTFDGAPMTPAMVKKLPTDPKRLYERALKATQGFRRSVDRPLWIWSTIHWALGSGASELSPAQRSAMVGAIAYVPGVRTLGETEDPRGRKTIGFVREGRRQRDELFFDADTSLPIYAHSINTAKRGRGRTETWPVGSVFQKSVIHETKVVDRVPATVRPKKFSRGPNGHYLCAPMG